MIRKGFSLIEITISIGILVAILALGIVPFMSASKDKELETIANAVLLKLEESKTDAISGKFGENSGVWFDTTSYTIFYGDSYDPDSVNNVVTSISEEFAISTDIMNDAVIFERVSGNVEETGTVTISEADDLNNSINIVVGPTGNLTIVK